MLKKVSLGFQGLVGRLKNDEKGASHILEIAAGLAVVAVILAAIFPNITQSIIGKINDTVTTAINSF